MCPGSRPADVGITLQPQASPAHGNLHSCLAVDVTITPAPELPRPDAPANPHNPHAEQAQKVHWTATRNKFQGRHHGPTANMNEANTTLLPFSIDPCGSLGFFANRLLFDPKPPDEPPWQKQSDFTSEAAFKAFSKAMTSPRLLPKNSNLQIRRNDPFRPHPQQSNTRALGNTNTRPQLRNFISPLPSTRSSIHDASPLDNSTRNPQIPLSPSRCKISLLSHSARPARRRPPNDSWPLASAFDSTYDNPNSAKNMFIDVRITDVDAKSNRSKDSDKVLAAHERDKMKKYLGACLEQRRHFFPFVVSTNGLLGKEAKILLRKPSAMLAEKWEKLHSKVCGYVNARMGVATTIENKTREHQHWPIINRNDPADNSVPMTCIETR
jgi:hypothetical protein